MELELTGHQVAKYRSTHSFHGSGIYTSTTQERKELREPPGRAAILGEQAHQGQPPKHREPRNPTCSARGRLFRAVTGRYRGCPSDTLSCHFREKKR